MILAFLKNMMIGGAIGLLHLIIVMGAISWPVMPVREVPRCYAPPVIGIQLVTMPERRLKQEVKASTEEKTIVISPVIHEQPGVTALQRVQMITRDLMDAALA